MVMAWYKVVTPDHATIMMHHCPSDTMVQALDISGPLKTNGNQAGCHWGDRLLSWNFLCFLSWFAAIIISFGLTFFVILSRQKPTEKGKKAENEYFESPSKALLKTIIMI